VAQSFLHIFGTTPVIAKFKAIGKGMGLRQILLSLLFYEIQRLNSEWENTCHPANMPSN
jgi:hypothetical protein